MARIDARDYQAALAEAESNYAKAQADLNEAMLAVERQPTVIRETEAQLRKVEAGIKLKLTKIIPHAMSNYRHLVLNLD